jgi:diguanylate cyclase
MDTQAAMDSRNFINEVHGYIRLALPLMSKENIPITPKNYSVWYLYVSGADEELSRTIDAMLREGEEFSEEKNDALYRRFCAEKDETELRRVRQDLQQVLRTILKEVTDLTGQTEEYESFVSHSVGTLSENASIQDIRNVISEIIDKTKTLGTFGKTIQYKLKETTEALEELKKDFEQVKTEVSVDFLTGIANRKAFDSMLTTCVNDPASGGKDLSLLLIDIDDFKRFNDEFGHLVGDEVLKFVAGKIRETVKGRDFLARFGGEEFAVILPQTSLGGAATLAESIRSLFAETSLRTVTAAKNLGVVAVSIGAACLRPGESAGEFVHRCDQALYAAKKAGKNRVVTVSNQKR